MTAKTETPWQASGRVMSAADVLEELIQTKLETPGTTREQALAWALEMQGLYAPKTANT